MNESTNNSSLGDKIVAGTIWMSAMRWVMRLIGLLNTIILVRLLTPEDFGVMGMVMIVYSFVLVFKDVGLDLALIQMKDITDEHYQTAWTLSLFLGILITLFLSVLPAYVADFYDDARLKEVMFVVAFFPIIASLSNVRFVKFRRELNFKKDFLFNVLHKLIALPITIAFALYFSNYWALVYGMLAHVLIKVVLSYIMLPWLPRLNFSKFGELIGFLLWVQFRNIGMVISQRLDQLVTGKLLGAEQLGGYYVIKEITEMLTNELVLPISRALLPGYSKIQDDFEKIQSVFIKVLSLHAIISLSITAGLLLIADELILILLGESWVQYGLVFQLLTIAGGVNMISTSCAPIFTAIGRVNIVAISFWVGLISLSIGLYIAYFYLGELQYIAMVKITASLTTFIFLAYMVKKQLQLKYSVLLSTFIRPFIAMLVMVFMVNLVAATSCCEVWVLLILKILIGAVSYTLSLFLLWKLSGKPKSIEYEILSRVIKLIKSRKKIIYDASS